MTHKEVPGPSQPEFENPENWMDLAACKNIDPDTFFPTDTKGVTIAKKICQVCIVREYCLEFAIETNQYNGVWGGTSERERRRIVRARVKEAESIAQ